jgi:hypothetical protein
MDKRILLRFAQCLKILINSFRGSSCVYTFNINKVSRV